VHYSLVVLSSVNFIRGRPAQVGRPFSSAKVISEKLSKKGPESLDKQRSAHCCIQRKEDYSNFTADLEATLIGRELNPF